MPENLRSVFQSRLSLAEIHGSSIRLLGLKARPVGPDWKLEFYDYECDWPVFFCGDHRWLRITINEGSGNLENYCNSYVCRNKLSIRSIKMGSGLGNGLEKRIIAKLLPAVEKEMVYDWQRHQSTHCLCSHGHLRNGIRQSILAVVECDANENT